MKEGGFRLTQIEQGEPRRKEHTALGRKQHEEPERSPEEDKIEGYIFSRLQADLIKTDLVSRMLIVLGCFLKELLCIRMACESPNPCREQQLGRLGQWCTGAFPVPRNFLSLKSIPTLGLF